MSKDFYTDYLHNRWNKRINYTYRTGTGLHRFYALIRCEDTNITIEFHHLKKSLVSRICGKSFYEVLDILGTPPKKHMEDFRNLIVEECRYQFKHHQKDWDESYIPKNLY